MSQLRLFCLGSPILEHRGENVNISLRKALALLIYLAVRKGKFSRDELATLLWPESDQSSARANLRRTLYVINKDLGEEILSSDKEIIFLNPQIDVWTDVEEFRRCVEESTFASESSMDNVALRTKLLENAAAFYKDDFLAGFTLPDSPKFAEWKFFEAESLRGSLVTSLQQLVCVYESQGEYPQALNHARHWLSLDPVDEPAHQRLMELYAKSGQHTAALRQYKECERILHQELGVPPQPETTALYQNIRLHRETEAIATTMVRPEVKYVASGDVHIAYVEIGDGPVDIIFVIGYISHMEQVWELPEVLSFFEELATFSRVILFDRRGVGLSERVGYPPTLEDTLDDILAVMDATGSKHPVLFGYLEGGPNCMLFTATYPERVSGLILYGTRAKWTRSEDYPWTITREQYDRWLQYLCENWGEPLNLNDYAPSRFHEPALQEWWAKLMRLASSPGGIKVVLQVMRDIDVRDILPAIRTPTLILQRRDDKIIRVGAARHLAGQIPGAKYVELEGQDPWFFFGDSQSVLREMETFVQNLGSPAVPDFMLATILLIELLDGSNDDVKDLSQMHLDSTYAFLRQEVARFRGSEVSWKESCYTATFDGPTRAMHCAKAIIETANQRNITLRCGLHTGECEFMAGDLVGSAVQIVAGVLQSAAPNEVLVSSTVKDLVVGSGFQFTEREQRIIEGVSGHWGIYSIN
jgi:DNA-binding SARP family transcriptional activator